MKKFWNRLRNKAVQLKGIVSIKGLEIRDALCALANAERPVTTGVWRDYVEKPGIDDAYFSREDLLRRENCATSALAGRYTLPRVQDSTFLSDIGIPVIVEELPTGVFIKVAAYDELHGQGVASEAIEHLQRTGSIDTRHLRRPVPPLAVPVRGAPLKLVKIGNDRYQYDTKGSGLTISAALGLLYSLCLARAEKNANGQHYSLATLDSVVPPGAERRVPEYARFYGITEPTDLMVAEELNAQTGFAVSIADSKFTITCDHSLAGEFNCLIESYVERCRLNSSRVIRWVSALFNVPLNVLLLIVAFDIEMGEFLVWIESSLLPIFGGWLATIWAPVRILSGALFGEPRSSSRKV